MKELPRCAPKLSFDGLIPKFGHDHAASESGLLDLDVIGWNHFVDIVRIACACSLRAEGGDEDDCDQCRAGDEEDDETSRGPRCDRHRGSRLSVDVV